MFRYELDKSSKKFPCPSCGQKRFVKMLDLKMGDYIGDEFGRCDRVNNCGYEKYPKNEPLHKEIEQKMYKDIPVPDNYDISEKVVDFFKNRGISLNTLKRFKVTGDNTSINFNFFKGDKLFNVKKRFPGKRWSLEGGAEMNFYNYDALSGDVVYITEGEIDCLSVYECDPNINVVSLPNGANSHKFLDSEIENLEGKEIVLCMDCDEAGIKGRDDLMVRLGDETSYIKYPDDCKDINEVLVKHGKEKALECLRNVYKKPISEIYSAEDYEDKIKEYILNGFPKGLSSGDERMDSAYTPMPGEFIVVTGVPNSGKSPVVDWLITNWLKHNDGVRVAYCSAESRTPIHIAQIAQHYLQRNIIGTGDFSDDVIDVMTKINDHYKFIETEELNDMSYTNVLSKMKSLNKRHGTNFFVIDPYNYIERGDNENNSHVKVLRAFANFAKRNNSIVALVAHPRKMSKEEDGNYSVAKPYDIAGTSDFYNVPDTILSFWRDFIGVQNEIGIRVTQPNKLYVQKLKNHWLGQCPAVVNIIYKDSCKSFDFY